MMKFDFLLVVSRQLTGLLLSCVLLVTSIHAEPSDVDKLAAFTNEFSLPSIEFFNNENRLSQQQQVYVRRILIRGCTVLSEAEIKAMTSPYVGRLVTMTELQDLRRLITQQYQKRGYITSGALIPDQKVKAGDVVYHVMEGQLENITVSGIKNLDSDYVLKRIAISQQQPINLALLQEHLVLLKQDIMINKLGAELMPGNQPGLSVLNLQIEERDPYYIDLETNNARSPSIGSEQLVLTAGAHSLTGWGDRTVISLQKTEGLQQQSVDFLFPISQTIDVLAAYQQGESEVVERPFNEIDVESKFYDALFGVRYSLSKQIARSINFSFLLQKRQSETFLLGEPYSFSANVQDRVSTTSVLKWVANWIERKDRQVFLLGSTLSRGLDAWGATINDETPDGRFTRWLGQFQYVYQFDDALQELFFRWDLSLSNGGLLPVEKLSIGGRRSVRGYRENTLVVDQGMIASLEYRFGVFENLLDRGSLQAALFVDYGVGENKVLPSPDVRHLSSVGVGLRWLHSEDLNASIYAAKGFKAVGNDRYDIQDSGIHFEFRYSLL